MISFKVHCNGVWKAIPRPLIFFQLSPSVHPRILLSPSDIFMPSSDIFMPSSDIFMPSSDIFMSPSDTVTPNQASVFASSAYFFQLSPFPQIFFQLSPVFFQLSPSDIFPISAVALPRLCPCPPRQVALPALPAGEAGCPGARARRKESIISFLDVSKVGQT